MDQGILKVCGLCSRLVDESMQLPPSLRVFLLELLSISDNHDLPNKVCSDCYQGSLNSKKFKEACEKTMAKLKSTQLAENMILGRSTEDKRQIEASEEDVKSQMTSSSSAAASTSSSRTVKSAKKTPAAPAAGNKVPGPARRSLSTTSSDVVISGPRASRASSSSTTSAMQVSGSRATPRSSGQRAPPPSPPPGPKSRRASQPAAADAKPNTPRRAATGKQQVPAAKGKKPRSGALKAVVAISLAERRMADEAQDSDGVYNCRKRKGSTATPSKSSASPPAKRIKREMTPTPTKTTPPSVSSFGRVRSKPKAANAYVALDDIEDESAPAGPRASRSARGASMTTPSKTSGAAATTPKTPSRATPSRAPAASSAPKPAPKSKRGNQKSAAAAAKEKNYYYVNDGGTEAESVDVAEDENDEEIFPSIGPYQCEICQVITSTKQEFVDHIKRFHRDVVDEDVLRSLENDLKKSKKETPKKATVSRAGVTAPAGQQNRKNEMKQNKKLEMQAKRKQQAANSRARTAQRKREIKAAPPAATTAASRKPGPASVKAAADKLIGEIVDSPDSTTPNGSDKVADSKLATLKVVEGGATPMDKESIGLDGEVVDDDEEDSKNCQFWKANVARKYQQENGEKDVLAQAVAAAEETEGSKTGDAGRRLEETASGSGHRSVAPLIVAGPVGSDQFPSINSAFQPVSSDQQQQQQQSWINASSEVPQYHHPTPMVQTFVPMPAAPFHLQQQQQQDDLNQGTLYSHQQPIFVTEPQVQNNGVQTVVVSGFLQQPGQQQMFY